MSPPINIPSLTTKTTIYVQYNPVTNNGGSPITNYNIYIDDGLNGPFSGPYANGLWLTWDSSALTLVTGRTYRITYSAVNAAGEGL